jgi:hypothetical protein
MLNRFASSWNDSKKHKPRHRPNVAKHQTGKPVSSWWRSPNVESAKPVSQVSFENRLQFFTADEHVHHYQRERASIKGLMLKLLESMKTGRLIGVARLDLFGFCLLGATVGNELARISDIQRHKTAAK